MSYSYLKLLCDVKYSRRYRHHQLYTPGWRLLYSDREVIKCLKWAKQEGYERVYFMGLTYDRVGRAKFYGVVNLNSFDLRGVFDDG